MPAAAARSRSIIGPAWLVNAARIRPAISTDCTPRPRMAIVLNSTILKQNTKKCVDLKDKHKTARQEPAQQCALGPRRFAVNQGREAEYGYQMRWPGLLHGAGRRPLEGPAMARIGIDEIAQDRTCCRLIHILRGAARPAYQIGKDGTPRRRRCGQADLSLVLPRADRVQEVKIQHALHITRAKTGCGNVVRAIVAHAACVNHILK